MKIDKDQQESEVVAEDDRAALQGIIDHAKSLPGERMKAIELKARLDGKLGHGKGAQLASTMDREALESYVSEALVELQRRK